MERRRHISVNVSAGTFSIRQLAGSRCGGYSSFGLSATLSRWLNGDDSSRSSVYQQAVDARMQPALHWSRHVHSPQLSSDRRQRLRRRHRSEEHTSELQSPCNLVCRLLLEKKKKKFLSGAPLYACSYSILTRLPASQH